jgi:hypothetical protein
MMKEVEREVFVEREVVVKEVLVKSFVLGFRTTYWYMLRDD